MYYNFFYDTYHDILLYSISIVNYIRSTVEEHQGSKGYFPISPVPVPVFVAKG